MKRALPITVSVIASIGAGALIGPSFIDWNKYKPQIVEQAKSAAGYDVRIDGDIKLSVLPSPKLKLEGLTVVSPRGSEDNLLTMKQADVSVSLLPLISGNIKIDTVRLVNPDIRLETLADGSNSWMSDKLLADKNAPQSTEASTGQGSGSKQSFSLDRLEIEDGRVSYLNRQTGGKQLAEKINLGVKADSLQGPFDIGGSLVYGGKTIEIDAKTKQAVGDKKEIPADLEISLPESNALVAFKGVIASAPLEIQGKLEMNADNLGSVLALASGGEGSPALAKKLAFSGLVTATEDAVQSEEMDITFGDAKGKGSVKVFGLKEQAPVTFNANMDFDGVLNLDTLAPAKDKGKEASVEEKVAKGQKLSPSKGLLPESVTLPFPLEGAMRVTADGIQTGGKVFKGVVFDLTKKGSAIDLAAKAMDMPGKTTVDATAGVRFASTSQSGEKGMTYADPNVAFRATGASEQLPTLLRAFVEKGGDNKALEIWKTGRFDLSGTVTPSTVSVSNSTLKLDETSVGLAAAYKPNGSAGRPDIMIDLTTDTVDIDAIQSRLSGQTKQAVQKAPSGDAAKDVKKSLEPLREFNMPYNLTFDLSAQKAILNAQQITGIRIKGKAAGSALNLEVASAQDYMGAAASLRGSVENLADLSGINMSFYGKTNDVKSLMTAFKMDTSKLPQSISAAEANIAAKGQADNLSFDAKIAALNGQLNAAGVATGLLDKPSFSNLTIGAKHPNLVKAIQIMNPAFTGGPGLEKPFEFNAKAVQDGGTYDLSGMKATLGGTSIGGDLKIATGGAKPSISGAINAGNIPLDDLLGAKNAAPKSGGGGAAAAGGGGAAAAGGGGSDGGKWSRATIETGWMHSMDVDMGLSAQSITYGGWNFQNPKTRIVLKDGNLTVDNLQSGLFGGTANLNAKVQDPADVKQPLSIAVDSKMSNVALESLVTALSGSNRLKASGDVSLDFNVQTTGLSSHALVSALQGKANLNGKSVVMKGFDLAQIGLAFVDSGKPLDRLSSVVGGAVNGGETRFDTITGAYNIHQGIVQISSMAMDGPSANIASKGSANLPAWTIDTMHTITFKQAKDAGAFDVAIKGSLSNPGNTFGKGLFNDLLTRRAQQKLQEKLGDKIQDKLGSDLGGKLQQLGILPGKQPAPAQAAPAGDTVTVPVDPAQQQQAPAADPNAAAPAQQQQQKPKSIEDQFKEDPAGAMQGILKGLGQ